MREQIELRDGRCRCGDVRLRITGPPLITMACHCGGCQRMTGGPYSISVCVPVESFTVSGRETVVGGVGEPPMHHHCPRCLSWVFTRADGWAFVNVRLPMLDDPSGLDPFVETQTADRLPFAATGARRSFAHFPPDDAWPALMAEYAASR